MRRREFIAGLAGVTAWPRTGAAQQGERLRRVSVLTSAMLDDGVVTTSMASLRFELQKLGWVEGRNLRLDFRSGDEDVGRTRAYAVDLVKLAPDVIVAVYGPALRAVQEETKSIPIVFIGAGAPTETGAVQNQAQPEGNVTGFANIFGSLGGKFMELLKEIDPGVTRVLYLYGIGGRDAIGPSVETAARSLGVQLSIVPVPDVAALDRAMEDFAREPNGAVLPNPGMLSVGGPKLIYLATQYRLPTIYGLRTFAADGGLMSYDSDVLQLVRGAASYVDRLLRGAKVSDLPVQYPTTFRLVVNLKAAKAIGLNVPASFLGRADEVIE